MVHVNKYRSGTSLMPKGLFSREDEEVKGGKDRKD